MSSSNVLAVRMAVRHVSHSEDMRPPLLLTGGPAAGKSATALRLVEPLRRAAVIDVDDIRHLMIAGRHLLPATRRDLVSTQRVLD